MTTLSEALYAKLAADVPFTSMLATYAGGPAIFTSEPIPLDARPPYLVIDPPIRVPDDGLGGERLDDISVDVRLFWTDLGSTAAVETATERVRDVLHRQPLAWSDWTARRVIASSSDLTAHDDYHPRVVTLRIAATRTA